MKKILSLLGLTVALMLPLYSQQTNGAASTPPPNPWKLLEQQSSDLAAGIKAQETHPLHALDAAIGKETTDLQADSGTLPADKKQAYEDGLKKLAELAHGIHVDGHHKQWDDATKKQAEFVAVLKQTEALVPDKAAGK